MNWEEIIRKRQLSKRLGLGKILTEAIETYLPNLPESFTNDDLRSEDFMEHFKKLCHEYHPNEKGITMWFKHRALNFITQFAKAYIRSGNLPLEITYKDIKGSSTLGQPVYRKTDLTKSNKVEKSRRSLARKLGFGKILVEAIETYLPNLPDTFSNLDLQHEDFHRHFKKLILNYHSNDNGRISSWFNYKVEGFISQFTKRYIESSNLPINVTYRKRDTPIYTKTDIVKSDWRGILQKLGYGRRDRQLWTGEQQSTDKVLSVDGKKYKLNPQHLQYYNQEKQKIKTNLPNREEKSYHRVALRRTIKQFNLSGAM